MKKNGFIATSLIYSFFLIFITLFLTIIADYIQNKMLLNTIEKGIKDEINDSMGIRNFEVGDLISFVSDCNSYDFYVDNSYVVSNVDYLNNKLILYSYALCDDTNDGCSSFLPSDGEVLNDFNDIPTSNQNATFYNKIIYNFDKTNSKTYKVGGKYYSVGDSRSCNEGNSYNTSIGCEVSTSTNYIRYKVEESMGSNRYKKCKTTEDDAMGVIYLKK